MMMSSHHHWTFPPKPNSQKVVALPLQSSAQKLGFASQTELHAGEMWPVGSRAIIQHNSPALGHQLFLQNTVPQSIALSRLLQYHPYPSAIFSVKSYGFGNIWTVPLYSLLYSKNIFACLRDLVPSWAILNAFLFSLQDNPPYDKGAFRIEINFPAEYPFKPPKITFKTKIYHPNIDEKGQVCLPVISAENWKPATKTDQGKVLAATNPRFSPWVVCFSGELSRINGLQSGCM